VGVSLPLPCTSLWKDQTVQWTPKNHFENNGGWDFQKLGYSFRKGHLDGEHQRSTNQAGPALSKLPHPVEGDKVPVEHMRNMLGKTVWVSPALGKGKPVHGFASAQGPGCTWRVMWKDGDV